MDDQIKLIIDEYIANINDACHILLAGINAQENLQLKTKWDFFEYVSKTHHREFDVGGINYKLHGRGCFAFSSELFLNWDFGYRSRWCGIDPWMVWETLEENGNDLAKCYDVKLLREACEQDLDEGKMFKKDGLYYFSIPINETFSPDFPREYDTLIIEEFDNKWILPRNKTIDRFIRKSNLVHNQIYKNENATVLRFLLGNNEIYSIPYDDICYPENAIKIMTDDIICNLRKS
ncbi:MAG: hypothetical protein K2N85_07410 [Lachnospiraceae bacterium]|nr:hypothetical protein [Lachnospiraceae bacterium]